MSIRFIRSALILVLLTTLTTACDTDGSTIAGPDPTVEPSSSTPAVEGTGDEPPAPGGGKKPSVKIAGGPAGDGGATENGDGSLCLDVRWLGGQDEANLGAGIAFEVTEVRLAGAESAGFSCPDDPCDGFTFDSNSDNCSKAVRPGNAEGRLSLYGRILCTASPQNCDDFRSNLKRRSIPIPASEAGGEGTGEPTETDEPTDPDPTQTRIWSRSRRAPMSSGHRRSDAVPDEEGSRLPHWIATWAGVIAPASVLSAVLFYFGYVSSRSQYEYFGVDVDAVGLGTQDYVMRSPQPLLVPLIVLTLLGAGLLVGHAAIRDRVISSADRRVARWHPGLPAHRAGAARCGRPAVGRLRPRGPVGLLCAGHAAAACRRRWAGRVRGTPAPRC